MSAREEQNLEELLADLATEGLTDGEQLDKLRVLLARSPDADPESWLLAAAALDRAWEQLDRVSEQPALTEDPARAEHLGDSYQLPDSLRRKVLQDAHTFFAKGVPEPETPTVPWVLAVASQEPQEAASQEMSSQARSKKRSSPSRAQKRGAGDSIAGDSIPGAASGITTSATTASIDRTRRSFLREFSGWGVAAAAILAAILGWLPATPAVPEAALAQLRREDPGVLRLTWGALESGYEGIDGAVWWSPKLKRGFLEIAGLPKNDPRARQYQLWIVDPERDREPIDGGVFDATGERQIVRIDAKLPVINAKTFALTLEHPGGVVVSEGPLLVAASVPE